MAGSSIVVHIPELMTPLDVAKTFAAYLVGARAFEVKGWSASGHPPYEMSGVGEGWQLDGSNDFWLITDNKVTRISCRYDHEIPALEAMMALFNWRFHRHKVPA